MNRVEMGFHAIHSTPPSVPTRPTPRLGRPSGGPFSSGAAAAELNLATLRSADTSVRSVPLW